MSKVELILGRHSSSEEITLGIATHKFSNRDLRFWVHEINLKPAEFFYLFSDPDPYQH